MHKNICLFVFCFFSLTTLAQNGAKTILIDKVVEMTVPAGFGNPEIQPVSDSSGAGYNHDMMILKHREKPIRITYQLAAASNSLAPAITDNDIPAWADKQLEVLKKWKGFTYIDDGIFLQDGKNIGYIKYKTGNADGRDTYQLLFFMSVNDRLFQANFICPAKMRRQWEPRADAIANSLRVKQ
jgi:hypothetical protein